MFCWGDNSKGQIGIGSYTNKLVPSQVASMAGITADVAIGGDHVCAQTTWGGAKCWGLGILGDGSYTWTHVPTGVMTQ